MSKHCRVLVGNIGYARDIDGSPMKHVARSHRHFYITPAKQKKILNRCKQIIDDWDPDLCCFIELDAGSITSGWFNQFTHLESEHYPVRDIASKYAATSKLQNFSVTKGKSNGFMAKHAYPFQRLYLSHGSKRLIYRIELTPNLALFFTHLSLRRAVRTKQLEELRAIADREKGEVIIAGDFNILAGLGELDILLGDGKYHLANDKEEATFQLFHRHYLLDLCITSSSLASRVHVTIIDQPYSDHDALLIDIKPA